MSTKKRPQIPYVSVDDPRLQAFIDAVRINLEMDQGLHDANEKRPTKQDLVDANVTNAEDIE